MSSPQIALVGTTRAGKSVLMTVLAKRMENKQNGVWLKPLGKTYSQIEEWWDTLQSGEWLPPTTPGTLLELNWDLCIQDKRIPMRMFDYAGENLTDLFNGKADNQQGAAKEFFDKVKNNFDNSTVIIVLLNLESFLATDRKTASENKGTLINAMTDFLKQAKNRSEELHIAFVFTAFDQYKATIESQYGSHEEFFRREIPPLYNEFIDTNFPVKVLLVSAVADTEIITDPAAGKTEIHPKPDFRSEGIDESLIPWLTKKLSQPQPQLQSTKLFPKGWYWRYNCNKRFFGLLGCREHRAQAHAYIKNNGGAGNITVTFTLNGKSNSETVFFNQDEIKLVYVVIYDLPNHWWPDTVNISNTVNINVKAAGQ